MIRVFLAASCILLLSCSPAKQITHQINDASEKFKDHVGFSLYDPTAKKTLISINEEKYFTPASNVKIFTLYAALKILGDSVPALRYTINHDSLIVWGTGDPSFMNAGVFDNRRTFDFLQNSPNKIFFARSNFQAEPWGPGWAWDDFSYAFSAERSPFPVYGNISTVKKFDNKLTITPVLLQNHILVGDSATGFSKVNRETDSNQITFLPGKKQSSQTSWKVPFHYSEDLLIELLSDTLKRTVEELNVRQPLMTKSFRSVPVDSLYSIMMKNSDNFVAEQLLLLCANELSDTLDERIAIRYAKKNLLADMPGSLIWVDGSGLSRYNLSTPAQIVYVWNKIYEITPRERIFPLLATGGQKGTLHDLYKSSIPFLFGKTGSLSGNVTLSGFILTKKGKVFIFSFMNSNFAAPMGDIRKMMETVLTSVRDKY